MVLYVGGAFPASRVLMSPPTHFKIADPSQSGEHGPANDFSEEGWKIYRDDPEGFSQNATAQLNHLRNVYNQHGVDVIELPACAGVDDLIFTADPSFSILVPKGDVVRWNASGILEPTDWEAVTIFSRFTNPTRGPEVAVTETFLKEQFPHRTFLTHTFNTEGTGDNVYCPFRDVIFSGYTTKAGAANGRSDRRAHRTLEDATGVSVISLEVQRPYFHIDTSLFPLSRGHMLVFKGGMTDEAYDTLINEAFLKYGLDPTEYMIEVSEEDALKLACNGQVIINQDTGVHTVVMPACSKALQDKIRKAGYEVKTVDLSYAAYAGGSIHCTSQVQPDIRVPGGWISYPEDVRYNLHTLGLTPQAMLL